MLFTILALAAAQPTSPPAPLPPLPRVKAPLEDMDFLVGHCWRGDIGAGREDTHCFEWVYGNRFIRDRHEVTGGYLGETLYNGAPNFRVEYTYWNSGGGVSRGTMQSREGLLDFGDEAYRDANGAEQRIATTWRRLDETSYEVRVTSSASPTRNRVVRYTRLDPAPVRIEEVLPGDGRTNLIHELVVPAPPAEVYRAFVTADGWKGWAVPNAWTPADDADLLETSYVPGGAAGDPRNIRQRFILRVPDRLVAFRTVQTPAGFPHAEAYKQVTTLVELESAGAGTRVRLSGIGYPAGAEGQALLGFFREGNRTTLEQLRTRFVTGPIDWAARRPAGH